ncbi:MAG: trimethylamine methyltransferase family protein [Pseudomonadota bacterium]
MALNKASHSTETDTASPNTASPKRRGRRLGQRITTREVDYATLISTLPLATAFSEDEVSAIHNAALDVLERIGVRILHDGARRILASAGALIDEDQVRIGPDLVDAATRTAPGQFTLTGPARTLTIGGRSTQFLPVGGPAHASDLTRGRRPGTFQDFRNFIRLAQSFDVLHMTGPSVEPQDVPTAIRHLKMMRVQLLDADKPTFVYARGAAQVADSFEMLRLRMSLDDAQFRARPHCFTVINTNSPLSLDLPMCQGLIDFAKAGQIVIVTPFTLAGAMAPVTIAGALVQQHAEFLAALTLSQTVRAGAPVVYGGFTSNVDMRSGAPAFGTPEYVRAAWGTGQLARRLGLPWRSSGSCVSNTPDAQAVWETQMALWGALTGGANLVLHSAGWLEGGLTASYEKFVLDVEQLQHLAELMQPRPLLADDLALEAIAAVGPGGHYFGTPHTMARYETAFYSPEMSDWSNYGQWKDAGALTATERAQHRWREILDAYKPPPANPTAVTALDDFVSRRIAEGGAEPLS